MNKFLFEKKEKRKILFLPLIASMKLVVPDLAIVPKFYIKSFLVIPIPVSVTDKVFSSTL